MPATTVPPAPTSVTIEASGRTPSSVNITWNHTSSQFNQPEGFIIHYVPLYVIPGAEVITTEQIMAPGFATRNFVLQNLDPNYSYMVSVVAYNSAGTSDNGNTNSATAPRKYTANINNW